MDLALRKTATPEASLDPLMDLTRADMERVNVQILDRAGSNIEMIPEVAEHLIASGGKRLRPMVTLAAARMFAYAGENHIKLATSVEFMHTATLLHDDVVDESAMRRGRTTARMIWGNQASVLVGDFLLGQAFKMMVEVGSLPALDVLSDAAAIIAEGEVFQLSLAHDIATTESQYLSVIGAKTAALFAAAAEVGPILADAGDGARRALRAYGTNLGLAFQLIDDVLDYGGDATRLGKNVGDDFREGKITMPVIVSIGKGTSEERAFWDTALNGDGASDEALKRALTLIAKHDALEDTMERARHYGELARKSLDSVEDSPQKMALLEVVDFCLARAY